MSIYLRPDASISFPIPGKDIAVEKQEIDLEQELKDGGVLFKALFLSLDPCK